MKLFPDTNNQAGITLVELIVSIVVIAVAVTGVLLAVQFTTRHSADPMIRQQAVAIADAYMEEILLKHYQNPEGGEIVGAESGEDRPVFDDVYDYKSLPDKQQPKDQTNSTMPGLENYQVSVKVENATSESGTPDRLGPSGHRLNQAAKVTVIVTHDFADVKFVLTGYKAKY